MRTRGCGNGRSTIDGKDTLDVVGKRVIPTVAEERLVHNLGLLGWYSSSYIGKVLEVCLEDVVESLLSEILNKL